MTFLYIKFSNSLLINWGFQGDLDVVSSGSYVDNEEYFAVSHVNSAYVIAMTTSRFAVKASSVGRHSSYLVGRCYNVTNSTSYYSLHYTTFGY